MAKLASTSTTQISLSFLEMNLENDLGEPLIATPIPIQGQLLVRGEKHLFLFTQ